MLVSQIVIETVHFPLILVDTHQLKT